MKKKMNLLEMSKNELKNAKAGDISWCYCGCKYAGPQEGPDDDYYGGSSTVYNGRYNYIDGYKGNPS